MALRRRSNDTGRFMRLVRRNVTGRKRKCCLENDGVMMDKFESVDQILDFAIDRERESQAFYAGLAEKAANAQMEEVFRKFAAEEAGHEKKLTGLKQGKGSVSADKVADLKIADYVVDVEPGPDMRYQDALVVAMKKEKAAFRLYSDLAAVADDPGLRSVLRALAQEEARHKLRFEIEYDDNILGED